MAPDPAAPADPSSHALALAGADLPGASPPVVRAEEAREVVVVLSRSRDPRREVYLDRCTADRVPVVVRPSGGGAVVLSPGTVAASIVVAPRGGERFPEPHFRRFCSATADALAACGVGGIATRGVSDLCLGERKIAGSSLRLWGERVLFQVSVLVCPDLSLLERYLRHPSREPAYRAGRPHREFVTSLRAAGFSVAPADVAAAIENRLEREASRS
ncbi:MAG TPA: hypothetical protein VMT19_05675 [Thermoanaerobaculaceae bacterium]|nr:hypothetical protein [Thermoanaerobaculaceae bacterium]